VLQTLNGTPRAEAAKPAAVVGVKGSRQSPKGAAQQHWIAETPLLAAAIFVLGKTLPAIHWTVFPGFERDFALFFAVGADGLMHLSRTSIVLSILKSHLVLHDIDIFSDIDCWPCKYDNRMIAYFWSFRLKENGFFLGLGPRPLPRGRCS
jgi:hypothetical protein